MDPSGLTFTSPEESREVIGEVSPSDDGEPAGDARSLAGRGKPRPCAYRAGYPLGRRGTLVGRPGQGTHSYVTPPNNWQSDRAIDIRVPVGTRVCAVFAGRIGPRIGPLDSSNPRLAGLRLTLVGATDEIYYAHLSKLRVQANQTVKKDQLLGYSGTANGVSHLHLGVRYGDALAYAP